MTRRRYCCRSKDYALYTIIKGSVELIDETPDEGGLITPKYSGIALQHPRWTGCKEVALAIMVNPTLAQQEAMYVPGAADSCRKHVSCDCHQKMCENYMLALIFEELRNASICAVTPVTYAGDIHARRLGGPPLPTPRGPFRQRSTHRCCVHDRRELRQMGIYNLACLKQAQAVAQDDAAASACVRSLYSDASNLKAAVRPVSNRFYADALPWRVVLNQVTDDSRAMQLYMLQDFMHGGPLPAVPCRPYRCDTCGYSASRPTSTVAPYSFRRRNARKHYDEIMLFAKHAATRNHVDIKRHSDVLSKCTTTTAAVHRLHPDLPINVYGIMCSDINIAHQITDFSATSMQGWQCRKKQLLEVPTEHDDHANLVSAADHDSRQRSSLSNLKMADQDNMRLMRIRLLRSDFSKLRMIMMVQHGYRAFTICQRGIEWLNLECYVRDVTYFKLTLCPTDSVSLQLEDVLGTANGMQCVNALTMSPLFRPNAPSYSSHNTYGEPNCKAHCAAFLKPYFKAHIESNQKTNGEAYGKAHYAPPNIMPYFKAHIESNWRAHGDSESAAYRTAHNNASGFFKPDINTLCDRQTSKRVRVLHEYWYDNRVRVLVLYEYCLRNDVLVLVLYEHGLRDHVRVLVVYEYRPRIQSPREPELRRKHVVLVHGRVRDITCTVAAFMYEYSSCTSTASEMMYEYSSCTSTAFEIMYEYSSCTSTASEIMYEYSYSCATCYTAEYQILYEQQMLCLHACKYSNFGSYCPAHCRAYGKTDQQPYHGTHVQSHNLLLIRLQRRHHDARNAADRAHQLVVDGQSDADILAAADDVFVSASATFRCNIEEAYTVGSRAPLLGPGQRYLQNDCNAFQALPLPDDLTSPWESLTNLPAEGVCTEWARPSHHPDIPDWLLKTEHILVSHYYTAVPFNPPKAKFADDQDTTPEDERFTPDDVINCCAMAADHIRSASIISMVDLFSATNGFNPRVSVELPDENIWVTVRLYKEPGTIPSVETCYPAQQCNNVFTPPDLLGRCRKANALLARYPRDACTNTTCKFTVCFKPEAKFAIFVVVISPLPVTVCAAGTGGDDCGPCTDNTFSAGGSDDDPHPACETCDPYLVNEDHTECTQSCYPGYGGETCEQCTGNNFSTGGTANDPYPDSQPCKSFAANDAHTLCSEEPTATPTTAEPTGDPTSTPTCNCNVGFSCDSTGQCVNGCTSGDDCKTVQYMNACDGGCCKCNCQAGVACDASGQCINEPTATPTTAKATGHPSSTPTLRPTAEPTAFKYNCNVGFSCDSTGQCVNDAVRVLQAITEHMAAAVFHRFLNTTIASRH
ncbi:hypothetical protein JKP88DRAFT_254412 [Tribonema minus]|uniref:Uncharacterized protein n=1 Tax=Tribonema minus TaxID=303371 RepID=A0A836CHZ4_9STRA|nr:hypothetical protein JKP88DRAFT_254412 [Tribonema minus]